MEEQEKINKEILLKAVANKEEVERKKRERLDAEEKLWKERQDEQMKRDEEIQQAHIAKLKQREQETQAWAEQMKLQQ